MFLDKDLYANLCRATTANLGSHPDQTHSRHHGCRRFRRLRSLLHVDDSRAAAEGFDTGAAVELSTSRPEKTLLRTYRVSPEGGQLSVTVWLEAVGCSM